MLILPTTDNNSDIARVVMEDLKDWFGRPEANQHYIDIVAKLEQFTAFDNDNAPIGFIAIKTHTALVAEAYILGVKRQWQRQGLGKRLFEHAERNLINRGVQYLTLKTLAPTVNNPQYEKTRQFYEAIGFIHLEILTELWNAETPCLMMLKKLSSKIS